MLKLDLGTIKNESTAFDLPPEGPQKERWAISRKFSIELSENELDVN